MCFGVDIEVDTVDRSTRIGILQYSLRSIAEGDDRQSLSSYGHTLRKVVHLAIRDTFWCYRTLHPCIEDACAIDAEKDSKTCVWLVVIDVSKGVDA